MYLLHFVAFSSKIQTEFTLMWFPLNPLKTFSRYFCFNVNIRAYISMILPMLSLLYEICHCHNHAIYSDIKLNNNITVRKEQFQCFTRSNTKLNIGYWLICKKVSDRCHLTDYCSASILNSHLHRSVSYVWVNE